MYDPTCMPSSLAKGLRSTTLLLYTTFGRFRRQNQTRATETDWLRSKAISGNHLIGCLIPVCSIPVCSIPVCIIPVLQKHSIAVLQYFHIPCSTTVFRELNIPLTQHSKNSGQWNHPKYSTIQIQQHLVCHTWTDGLGAHQGRHNGPANY